MGEEPYLTDAALDLVIGVARLRRKRRQLAAELDNVAVAVLPIVEEGEIVAYGLDVARHGTDIVSGGRRVI